MKSHNKHALVVKSYSAIPYSAFYKLPIPCKVALTCDNITHDSYKYLIPGQSTELVKTVVILCPATVGTTNTGRVTKEFDHFTEPAKCL